jgi:cytochrome c oxidase subunit III
MSASDFDRIVSGPRRRRVDVLHLPGHVLDHRSPIWWGNVLLLFIETTMFVLLVASYFYLRLNFDEWPPPQVNRMPARLDTTPSLGLPTVNLVLLLLSCIPMFIADRAALHRKIKTVRIGMAVTIAMGILLVAIRFKEFGSTHFAWNDNAYASVVWTLLGMHLLHLIIGTLENITMGTWLFVKGMDNKHARDVRVGAVYWYWIALIWVPLYIIIYLYPRISRGAQRKYRTLMIPRTIRLKSGSMRSSGASSLHGSE